MDGVSVPRMSRVWMVIMSNRCLIIRFAMALGAALSCGSLSGKESDADFSADNIRVPIYQGNSVLPASILTAEEARPVGTKIELKGVKLNWIGDAISDVRGVVTTPSAVCNRATKQVYGSEWVKYRSDALDLDGVGFDIDQVKQIIHVRSQVKVVIKGKLETTRQRRAAKGEKLHVKPETVKRLISMAEGLKNPSIDSKNKSPEKQKKIRLHISTILWWIFGVAAVALVILSVMSEVKSRRSGRS